MTLTAHDGTVFPNLGLGTYNLNGFQGVTAIKSGLHNGYRLLDAAVNYENEGTVGRAVRDADIDRSEVIVASKLPGRRHDYDAALYTIEESVFRTGLESIDLYLIHWPNPITGKYVDAWRGLIAAQQAGLVRHIGVSNFLPEHLIRIEEETGVRPVLNQIELHPYFPQTEQIAFHQERGIVTQAWSPIGRNGDVAQDPVIQEIAQARGETPTAIILAWHAAIGVMPIPKSADPERQRANLQAMEMQLHPDEVARISALGKTDGRLWDLDPATHEEM